jgi:hypothetical protein
MASGMETNDTAPAVKSSEPGAAAAREATLERLRRWYQQTKNPLYIWEAIARCLHADNPPAVPDWCLDYLRKGGHRGMKYLHWNMRDINYGFAALEHRYRVLGGGPIVIEDDKKIDLARLLIDVYGVGYAGHPRLVQLLAMNHISHWTL